MGWSFGVPPVFADQSKDDEFELVGGNLEMNFENDDEELNRRIYEHS